MDQHGLAAYIIPSADPHQSEYVADFWAIRSWISGFTGSSGLAVITKDHAGVWTDSRYFLQAEQQLVGTGAILHKQTNQFAAEHIDWLCQNLPAGNIVAVDGRLFTIGQVAAMSKTFQAAGLFLQTHHDLITPIWSDRPAFPASTVFEHELHFAGVSRADKLQNIYHKISTAGAHGSLVPALDEIAWVLNLRGSDVECNPVFYAYLYLDASKSAAWLFTDFARIAPELQQQLKDDQVHLRAYDQLDDFLSALPANTKVLLDAGSVNYALSEKIGPERQLLGNNYIKQAKAIKNPVEIAHIKSVMVKDGVALVRTWRWLEACLFSGQKVDEVDVSDQLAFQRSLQKHYIGESFAAIIGYNSNGAIVHYRPTNPGSAVIRREGILLLDSGGQYLDGTTDITRTIALGLPTEAQKTHFTLVLKGHIALAMQKFPKGTKGIQLDTLARMALWQHQLDYGHGTGHGVGFFMNVHEPPQGFTPGINERGTTMQEPGMLSSNEPGIYITGAYGIRTENLMIVEEAGSNDFGTFYQFNTVTLFPIDTTLVIPEMLSTQERDWLNNYHLEVHRALTPYLDQDEQAWLAYQCRPI